MRNFLYTILCVCAVMSLSAQQLPRFTQLSYSSYAQNPGVAGSEEHINVRLAYRNQWAGAKFGINTMVATAHGAIANNMGAGVKFFTDNTGGAISTKGFELTYSYKIAISDYNQVCFGLSGVMSQYSFDNTSLVTLTEDEIISGGLESKTAFDAVFGLHMYGANYFAGIAIPQLFESTIGLKSIPDGNFEKGDLVRHVNMMAGYKYDINTTFSIEPQVLLRTTFSSPIQAEVSFRGGYKDMFFLGLGYRHNDAFAIMAQFEYSDFIFGYSYDITTTAANVFSPTTHEIVIGYNIQRSGGFQPNVLGGRRLRSSRKVKE